jgi:polar amino acid transport system substrate-binding protein
MKKRVDSILLTYFTLVLTLLVLYGLFSCKPKQDKTSVQEEEGKLHLVVATDATWPPMEYLNEDDEIVGFEIDLMKAAAELGGFSVEFKNIPWDGILAGLSADKYDAVMSSVTITSERQVTMDFSMPYINAGQVLIVRQETSGVATLQDLKGNVVGAQKDTTGSFEIVKVDGVKLKTYSELSLAIDDLTNRRIEGVVADTPAAVDFALHNPAYRERIKIVGEPFTDEYYAVAVKKGNKRILDIINSGLKKVLEGDVDKRLRDKWLR